MRRAYAAIDPAPDPRPGPTRMPLRLGPVDEVGDHEVVAAVALAADHLELEVDPGLDVPGHLLARVALLDAAPHLLDEPRLLGLAVGHIGARHVAAVGLGELDVAALGDQQCVVARLGHAVPVGPQRTHLLCRLDVVAAAVELEPLRVVDGLAGRDADQERRAQRRRQDCCSASRWSRRAGCRVRGRAGAGRRAPASRSEMSWSISSRKKLSLPKMSWNSAADRRASSY